MRRLPPWEVLNFKVMAQGMPEAERLGVGVGECVSDWQLPQALWFLDVFIEMLSGKGLIPGSHNSHHLLVFLIILGLS